MGWIAFLEIKQDEKFGVKSINYIYSLPEKHVVTKGRKSDVNSAYISPVVVGCGCM